MARLVFEATARACWRRKSRMPVRLGWTTGRSSPTPKSIRCPCRCVVLPSCRPGTVCAYAILWSGRGLVGYFRLPHYLRVLGGRPVLYLLAHEDRIEAMDFVRAHREHGDCLRLKRARRGRLALSDSGSGWQARYPAPAGCRQDAERIPINPVGREIAPPCPNWEHRRRWTTWHVKPCNAG